MKNYNNPLNIRYNKANCWLGQIEPRKGFCQFKELFYGYRAAVLLVLRYFKFNVNTIRLVVSRWAPSIENNTDAYIRFVSKEMDKDPDTLLVEQDIKPLILAMSRIEQGEFYSSWADELCRVCDSLGVKC